ncbi:MAG: transposase [Deltaproteobacteria bacterium]|nr:transposase [Deltaproteobacteria bacterium]
MDTIFMEPRASSGVEEVKSGSRYIKNASRREYEEWFKAQVVEECHKPGASVSIVARRHDINANVLFRWRREYRLGILKPAPRPERNEAFVSVGVIDDDGKLVPSPQAKLPAIKALPALASAPRPAPAVVVELHLSGRIKIRIQGDVNKDALRGVLAVASELA